MLRYKYLRCWWPGQRRRLLRSAIIPVEEYVPPGVPVRVTLAMPALEQYGDAAYTIVAVGAVVMVIVVVAMTAGHPAAAAMVYVTV